MWISGHALLLILVANSAPILVRQLFYPDKWSFPLDCKLTFFDGQRLLGQSKTWRGFIAAVLATSLCATALDVDWYVGFVVGLLAMLGDSFSSFIKRRLAMPPSSMAIGLDQIPESLLPLIYLHSHWQLDWLAVLYLVLLFIVMELVFSRILFRLHIRKRPY
jgi:CDP-diglyceride synthetase